MASQDGKKCTREKRQYPMYLTSELREHVNRAYREFNADRAHEDKPDVEKHRDFNQGLIECALDNNWEDYVEQNFESRTD
jgi:hypothetical protein